MHICVLNFSLCWCVLKALGVSHSGCTVLVLCGSVMERHCDGQGLGMTLRGQGSTPGLFRDTGKRTCMLEVVHEAFLGPGTSQVCVGVGGKEATRTGADSSSLLITRKLNCTKHHRAHGTTRSRWD